MNALPFLRVEICTLGFWGELAASARRPDFLGILQCYYIILPPLVKNEIEYETPNIQLENERVERILTAQMQNEH